MTHQCFENAEIWLIAEVVSNYFKQKEQEFQHSYEIARFQISPHITKQDRSKLNFPWEKSSSNSIPIEKMPEERAKRLRALFEKLDKKAALEYEQSVRHKG